MKDRDGVDGKVKGREGGSADEKEARCVVGKYR